MKKVIEEYLEKVSKMGVQLKNERLRQLNNCQKQFDKKIQFLVEQINEAKDKYSQKFKEYLDKHQATVKLSEQYSKFSNEDDDKDFSELKKLFLINNEEEIDKMNTEESMTPVSVDDVQLQEKTHEEKEIR